MRFGNKNNTISIPDRIISSGSYLTMGLVGFIWLIIVSIQKLSLDGFLKYHIIQSIFITVLTAVIGIVSGILFKYALLVPVVGSFVEVVYFFFTGNILGGLSIIRIIYMIIVLYFAITALLGKYSYFPWISDNVKQMV